MMSNFLQSKDVEIFPITTARSGDHSDAHYIREQRLVKWISSIVDKTRFVIDQDFELTGDVEIDEDKELRFFIDGYLLTVNGAEITGWISRQPDPDSIENIYACLNFTVDKKYVFGDNLFDDEDKIKLFDSTKRTDLNSTSYDVGTSTAAKVVFSTTSVYDSSAQEVIVIRKTLADGNNYWVDSNSDTAVIKITANNTLDFADSALTTYLQTLEYADTDNVYISFFLQPAGEFLGLELRSSTDGIKTSIILDNDTDEDAVLSTPLHILTKQSEDSPIYIVPKASKLKFDSYSINVDGGEV